MNLSQPQSALGRWRGGDQCGEESGKHRAHVEPPVKPILEFGEVAMGVLGEVEGVVGAADRGLEVPQHGVDRLELLQGDAPLGSSTSTPRRVSSFIRRVMRVCRIPGSCSSVGAAASSNTGKPSAPHRYTPSSTRQCRWMLRLAAEPKRWISVTAPLRPWSAASPAWPSRWRVRTRSHHLQHRRDQLGLRGQQPPQADRQRQHPSPPAAAAAAHAYRAFSFHRQVNRVDTIGGIWSYGVGGSRAVARIMTRRSAFASLIGICSVKRLSHIATEPLCHLKRHVNS